MFLFRTDPLKKKKKLISSPIPALSLFHSKIYIYNYISLFIVFFFFLLCVFCFLKNTKSGIILDLIVIGFCKRPGYGSQMDLKLGLKRKTPSLLLDESASGLWLKKTPA